MNTMHSFAGRGKDFHPLSTLSSMLPNNLPLTPSLLHEFRRPPPLHNSFTQCCRRVFTEEGGCCCAVSSFALVASNATKVEALKRRRINIYFVLSLLISTHSLSAFLSFEFETETSRNSGCVHPVTRGVLPSGFNFQLNNNLRSDQSQETFHPSRCEPARSLLICVRFVAALHPAGASPLQHTFHNNMSCFYRNENKSK